jgi:hypothetical protein
MLTVAYFMLATASNTLTSAHHFEQPDKQQLAKRLIRRLRDLRVAVEVKAA